MVGLILPIGSDHERTRRPVATWALVTTCLLVDLFTNMADHAAIARQFGFVAAQPQWYQFVTHLFLHVGWPTAADAEWTDYANCLLHIFGNMAYLWFAGRDLEDVLGAGKYLALYLAGGVASALLFWIMAVAGHFSNLHEPAVGASGAVSALLGFYVVRFPRFKIRLWCGAVIPVPFVMRQGIARISSLVFIGFWIAVQLFLGIHALRVGGAQVAYWGHIGGFVLGALVAAATRQWRHGGLEYLLKEADHRFYKQQWYPAMELYQQAALRHPRGVEAVTKWALCWECAGQPARAAKVLTDATAHFEAAGWADEAATLREELDRLSRPAALRSTPPANQYPNLLFRRQFKWKGKTP